VEIFIAIILLRKAASDGKSLSVFGVAVSCCGVDLVRILICFGGLKREIGIYNEIVKRIVSNCSRELIKIVNSL
jgi:hypothetical protein